MLFSALIGINAAMALAGAIGTNHPQNALIILGKKTDSPIYPSIESGVSTIFVGLGEDP